MTSQVGFAGVSTLVALGVSGHDALVAVDGWPNLESVDHLSVVGNPSMPPSAVSAAFEGVEVAFLKVDGNAGQPVPHVEDCPWLGDGECDEALGTGLCTSDPGDC